jgi:hypothetical protein
MEKTDFVKKFIHREVVTALIWSRLPHDHAIGGLLEKEAQVVGRTGAPCVQVVDECGNWRTLADRIEELKADPQFRETVPNPDKVNRSDEERVRENFARIADGTAVVE